MFIESEDNVKCPVRESENEECQNMVRPVGVHVITPERRHTITCDGLSETLHPYFCGRGVVTIREYVCEAGHRWAIYEQFHKGYTFTETKILPYELGPEAVIWRN